MAGESPTVHLPSLTVWSNGTSFFTAALYSRTVFRNCSALTPSSFGASSSSEPALSLVTNLMRYSERRSFVTLESNTCQANCPGCFSTSPPYLA
ncbi:hypothetical protein D3C83_99430 [compost metagenome]